MQCSNLFLSELKQPMSWKTGDLGSNSSTGRRYLPTARTLRPISPLHSTHNDCSPSLLSKAPTLQPIFPLHSTHTYCSPSLHSTAPTFNAAHLSSLQHPVNMAHPAFCSMANVGIFSCEHSGSGVKISVRTHLFIKLRKSVAIPQLPYTISCYDFYLSTGTTFFFTHYQLQWSFQSCSSIMNI